MEAMKGGAKLENRTFIYDKKNNVIYFSILYILILSLKYNSLMEFTILWISYIILTGNILRIPKNNVFTKIIRYMLYTFLCYCPLFFSSSKVNIRFSLIEDVGVVLIGMLFLFLERKKYRLLLSEQFLLSIPKKELNEYVLKVIQLVYASIGEEIFFRWYILNLPLPLSIKCTISSMYFILYHYVTPWGSLFSKKDLVKQLFVSLISTILFMLNENIVPSIILHLTVNSVPMIVNLKNIKYHYIEGKGINKNFNIDDENLF